MIHTLMELANLAGPSGAEEEVREYLMKRAMPVADDMRVDALGNLMVFRKGKRRAFQTIALTAHMDEVGVIVKDFTEEGMVKFGFLGGVDSRVAIGRRFIIGKKKIPAVMGIKAIHLTTEEERQTMPKTEDLYLDIGASNKEEAMSLLAHGESGVFEGESRRFGDGLILAPAIDNRFGCAALLTLLLEEPPVDAWFCFTVQEEVGLRGAKTMAYALRPDVCLVLESTTAADLADVRGNLRVCELREGVVIPFMDRGTIYDQDLFAMLTGLANEKGIPWQTKQMVAGGTDAGAIHKSATGVKTAVLAAPVRYLHSAVGVASVSDMEHTLRLSRYFLEKMGEPCHA